MGAKGWRKVEQWYGSGVAGIYQVAFTAYKQNKQMVNFARIRVARYEALPMNAQSEKRQRNEQWCIFT